MRELKFKAYNLDTKQTRPVKILEVIDGKVIWVKVLKYDDGRQDLEKWISEEVDFEVLQYEGIKDGEEVYL